MYISWIYVLRIVIRHHSTACAMEEIRDIVGIIQKSCRNGGVEVSDVLAAFVARTVCVVSKEKKHTAQVRAGRRGERKCVQSRQAGY
jgi:hypothetical protein